MPKASSSRRRFLLATAQAVFEQGSLRQVIVEAEDGYAVVRLRGLDTRFTVPWGAVYHLAAAQAAERELRARKAEIGI